MKNRFHEIIRRHSEPLQPLETGERPRWTRLSEIEAVMFDIYGTLLISGSGDVGGGDSHSRAMALAAALQTVGVSFRGSPEAALEVWDAEIEQRHREARLAGVDFPEVDILEVWHDALAGFAARGWTSASDIDVAALAVEFEVRTNPVWPMPGMMRTLEALRAGGKTLGAISNAQFFTPEIFPALVGQTLDELGFARDLQFYSYQYGQAKPGVALYRLAVDALERRGVRPERVLYVGNDIRNDIAPAARCGFRTALFAGDLRSLRRRPDDPQCVGAVADVVVTQLCDLLDCAG
jgi:putative hydrolase of the HAD superfamily